METNNFFQKIGQDSSISTQSLIDQRLKLNPVVFTELNKTYLETFYTEYIKDVKTFKGYILKAIDGSDVEIPNTNKAKETFGIVFMVI